jgi:hypothetical protein
VWIAGTLAIAFMVVVALAAWPKDTSSARGIDRAADPPSAMVAVSDQSVEAAPSSSQDPLVLSYAAKFVCMEPIQPGTYYYGLVAPLVKETTGVLIHNPNSFPVKIYKKAVRAPVEEAPPVAPGAWLSYTIGPDFAFRIDCDDIAKLLTGNAAATFIGTYGIGVEVEGFVVIEVGPQTAAGSTLPLRYSPLDVTAEYARSSEVFKKDVHYQPWWWWWWWPLPWRLGYAYERVVPIQAPTANIDCRGLLYSALVQDAQAIADTQQRTLTLAALDAGLHIDPTNVGNTTSDSPPALVALIGKCNKLVVSASLSAEIDYVLLSNKTCTDADPRTPAVPGQCGVNLTTNVIYPWLPGHWYDLPVVMPQNRSTDLDAYFRQWHAQQWITAGAQANTVNAAMVYWFPYWCGWGYWNWWWNSGDCVNAAVGEGESLDVEQVNPTRVFMNQWPPVP